MDVAITELEKIDADRVDGVGMPANGIPILMLKQVAAPVAKGARDCPKCDKSYDADHQGSKCENCGTELPDAPASKAEFDRDAAKELAKAILANLLTSPAELLKAVTGRGKVDEAPDIDLGNQILAMLGRAISAEADEMAAGQAGEADDIMELACAAQAVRCWRDGEQAVSLGDVMPASMLMQSAADDVEKAKHSAADRRKLAEQGNALSDGSYPIADEEDLKSAAILAQSGHGDVEGAKRLIGRRAKELGVKNPLESDGDTSKEIAKGEADVDTETQTGDLTEVVKAAEAKAAALEKRVTDQDSVIKALEGRLAKVEQAPVPGGPVMSAVRPGIAADDDHARKARYYDEWAERVSDPSQAGSYRQLAAQERAKITS
jgi:hypothetical protein